MSNLSILDGVECSILPDLDENVCVGSLIPALYNAIAILEKALLEQVNPAGFVEWSACPPENRPRGFILADGSYYSPEVFPNLFDCIQYHYGQRPDGCFRVPDLRSVAVRGLDIGRNCLSDLTAWSGFTAQGNAINGSVVGAQQDYDADEGTVSQKEMLLTPLISTGEICL